MGFGHQLVAGLVVVACRHAAQQRPRLLDLALPGHQGGAAGLDFQHPLRIADPRQVGLRRGQVTALLGGLGEHQPGLRQGGLPGRGLVFSLGGGVLVSRGLLRRRRARSSRSPPGELQIALDGGLGARRLAQFEVQCASQQPGRRQVGLLPVDDFELLERGLRTLQAGQPAGIGHAQRRVGTVRAERVPHERLGRRKPGDEVDGQQHGLRRDR